MDMKEYLKVKDFSYLEYCDYLQSKYGIGLDDYMTKSYNSKRKCQRTKEGLISHHKKEDIVPNLSVKDIAIHCPFEWQQKENIVYCDYLEHLLLHTLICKHYSDNSDEINGLWDNGITLFLVPELNDLYSGWETKQLWRKNCHDKVINDKDVYLKILKQLINYEENDDRFNISILCNSFNEKFGLWSNKKNQKLYNEIHLLM